MKIVIPIALFIAFLAVGPCPVTGQSQSQVPRIGVLSASSRAGGEVSRRELLKGLENLGYVERKNILMEYRYADNKRGRLPKLASKLVDRNVDILLAYGPPTIAAAIKATKTIPIVMVSGGDVVGRGFVPNLTQPGGNVTGLHSLSKSSGRRIELFKETIPTLSRVVVLNSRKRKNTAKRYQRHGKTLGVAVSIVDIRKGSELAKAFEQIAGSDPDGMLIVRHHVTRSNAKKIADFAIANQLPTMYRSEDFVELGGLMSYGLNYRKMYRRAATYVDKILKGAKPGSLAIEPPRHKFVINLKTAKKIGVQIPPEILLEANDVIQ